MRLAVFPSSHVSLGLLSVRGRRRDLSAEQKQAQTLSSDLATAQLPPYLCVACTQKKQEEHGLLSHACGFFLWPECTKYERRGSLFLLDDVSNVWLVRLSHVLALEEIFSFICMKSVGEQ